MHSIIKTNDIPKCPEGYRKIYLDNKDEVILAIREDFEPLCILNGSSLCKKNILTLLEDREHPVLIYTDRLPSVKLSYIQVVDKTKEFQGYKIAGKLWQEINQGKLSESSIALLQKDDEFDTSLCIYVTRFIANKAKQENNNYIRKHTRGWYNAVYQIAYAGLLNQAIGTRNWRDTFAWLINPQQSLQGLRHLLKSSDKLTL